MQLKMPRKVDIALYVILTVAIAILGLPVIISVMGMETYPVISDSMLHWRQDVLEENFYELWEVRGYNRSDIMNLPFPDGFGMGDLIIVAKEENFSIGDVVVWDKGGGAVMTHRLIYDNGSALGIVSDNLFNFTETDKIKWINRSEAQEKVIFVIPKLGVPYLFLACMQNRYCGLPCFFDTKCLRNSFGV